VKRKVKLKSQFKKNQNNRHAGSIFRGGGKYQPAIRGKNLIKGGEIAGNKEKGRKGTEKGRDRKEKEKRGSKGVK
jgi:hypothetical protein